jgi:CDP-paratose 2-epimerase
MRILILGACGFVGSSLAQFFRAACPDWEIVGVDNFIRQGSEENRLQLRRLGIKIIHGDIRAASDFEALPAVDFVIDAAANPSVLAGVDGRSSSRQVVEHNLAGTINILEFCKRHSAGFILLSTSRVYSVEPLAALPVRVHEGAFVPDERQALPTGLSSAGVSETFATRAPVSIYGSTKLASEILALEYGESFHFPVWINRCGVLAGAGQFGRPDQGIFAYWLHCWKQRRPLKYIGFDGQGHQTRDALHPEDLARLLVLQIGCNEKRESVINVSGGAGQSMSLRQLSIWCEKRWHAHPVTSDPQPRPFDLPWLVLDSTKASALWKWKPEFGLPEILEQIAVRAETRPDWLDLSEP